MKEKQINEAYVSIFGLYTPGVFTERHLIKRDPFIRPPSGSYFAISAHVRESIMRNIAKESSWFAELSPVARIGKTIFLYRAP